MANRSRTCVVCGEPKFLKELWQQDFHGKDICTECKDQMLAERIKEKRRALGLDSRLETP